MCMSRLWDAVLSSVYWYIYFDVLVAAGCKMHTLMSAALGSHTQGELLCADPSCTLGLLTQDCSQNRVRVTGQSRCRTEGKSAPGACFFQGLP